MLIYVDLNHRRTRAVLILWAAIMVCLLLYLPYEDSNSMTTHRFPWDPPVIGGHLDLGGLLINLTAPSILLLGGEFLVLTVTTLLKRLF